MKVLLAIALLLITACDAPKSSQQATDDALEAVLRYKKLKAEGKLPTVEEQAELRRQIRERTDRISSELRSRIKTVASECFESHPNNPELIRVAYRNANRSYSVRGRRVMIASWLAKLIVPETAWHS
jgi:metal-dependent amidase/aminoacylase/carboxypeptidase family protein